MTTHTIPLCDSRHVADGQHLRCKLPSTHKGDHTAGLIAWHDDKVPLPTEPGYYMTAPIHLFDAPIYRLDLDGYWWDGSEMITKTQASSVNLTRLVAA